MFGKISKLALGMSLIGGMMESQAVEMLDLAQMIKNTTEQEDLSQSIIEEISPQYPTQQNEEVLIQASNKGNCIAQYELAECYSEMAMEQYGSEKFETKRKKALLLLVSAVKGKFWRSTEELKFVMNGTTEKRLSDIESLPEEEMSTEMEKLAITLSEASKL